MSWCQLQTNSKHENEKLVFIYIFPANKALFAEKKDLSDHLNISSYNLVSLFFRFSRNVFRQHPMCNSWARKNVGVGAVLRTINVRRVGRQPTEVSWLLSEIPSKLSDLCFSDSSNLLRIADRCLWLTINANWILKPQTKQQPFHTAALTSSAKLAPNWNTLKSKRKSEIENHHENISSNFSAYNFKI